MLNFKISENPNEPAKKFYHESDLKIFFINREDILKTGNEAVK